MSIIRLLKIKLWQKLNNTQKILMVTHGEKWGAGRAASNLTNEQLTEIESYGLISIRGRHYDSDALSVAKAVAEISAFGIGARHLRAFKTAADREIGLVEQITTPLLRQKGSESKARAEEVERELASLSIRLHASLVRAGLHRAK